MNIRGNELDRTILGQTIAILAAEHRAERTPVGVEQAVLAEFDGSRRRTRRRIGAVGAAIAAMLAVGAFVSRERPLRYPRTFGTASSNVPQSGAVAVVSREKRAPVLKPQPGKHAPARHEAIPRENAARPFVAIPYTVPLAPEERATVVRITLSPSAIAAVGFPLPAIDPGIDTLADVLVGEDGRAHAIRLVTDFNFR